MKLARRRTLGEIVSDSFALYAAHRGVLVLVALAVVVPVDLIVLGFGLGQLTAPFDRDVTQAQMAVELGVSYLVTTPLVTSMVIFALGAGRPGAGAAAGPRPAGDPFAQRAERPGALAPIQAGLDVFAPVLLVMVLYGALVVAGFLVLIVPGVIAAVRLGFVVQAVVVDGRRGSGAIERSWQLTRRAFWRVLGITLVVNVVAALFSALVAVPFTLAAEAVDAEAAVLVGRMLAEVVTLPLVAVAITLLFFDLRDRAGAPQEPAAPA